jgi:potassium-dependent mechanosensitive channel
MKFFYAILILFFSGISASAQVNDSAKLVRESSGFSLFTNEDTLTNNDYLLSIEKVFQTLNKASVLSQPIPSIVAMGEGLNEDDSAISIIKSRLSLNDRELNVRNLQMFTVILKQINKNAKNYANKLKQYDSILGGFKKQILDLQKDSALKHVFKSPELTKIFKPQLVQLALKWQKTDSLMKHLNLLIDNTLARTSNNIITTDELQLEAENLRQTTGSRAFSKERKYLWDIRKSSQNPSLSEEFKTNLASEKKITNYYFSHTNNQLLLLLLTGIIFFAWVFYNFRSIKKYNKTASLAVFQFRYLYPLPVFASLIFILNLAPLFDLDAPFIYIATIEFFLMLTLTFSFAKRLPKKFFYLWLIFIGIFLVQSFSRYFGLPFYIHRLLLFILNILAVLLGLYAILKYKGLYFQHRFLILSVGLYTFFNFLAVVSNLFGRVTLMQILGSTGTYALIQTASLLVFIEIITEAVLLQIQASRIRKGYSDKFKFKKIAASISKLVIFWAVIIWLIVFATNLNIYNSISGNISQFLSTSRNIGSFSFSFGGIILFTAIMWASNFLQKYIPFFFGDVGDISVFHNKAKRSRLMIFRLILVVAGFLLAIAASGLALDKITVILGALSVGIGLGLQSIVNNFVSGIILIFDQTLRIGDSVEIGDKKGRVKEISLRSSRLMTAEGAEVIIPNGEILSKNFVNWSLGNNFIRVDLSFAVDKMVDSSELRNAIMETIKSYPDLLAQREPEIFNNTITSEATQLKVYFWCRDVNKRDEARSKVYQAIFQHLQEKDIQIK